MKNQLLFITCEHGGNAIPDPYKPLFIKAEDILASHRGYDIGALNIAQQVGKGLADFHYYAKISRLLVELNRSIGDPNLWSEFTRDLSKNEKQLILNQYYFPYRNHIEAAIKEAIEEKNSVIHISIHSFTPKLHDEVRHAEIGLLYDPTRKLDKQFCAQWKKKLEVLAPQWRIRCNYPYRGTSDGFTTYLRKRYRSPSYIGIELEMNQKLLTDDGLSKEVSEVITKSLQLAIFE